MFYCELLSGVWIGDVELLNSNGFMKDNEINIIINCTQLFDFPNIHGIQKVRLPFPPKSENDNSIMLMRENKDKIIDFIFKNLEDKNILICCYDGKSISAFLVAMLIKEKSKISKSSIYPILKTKNDNIYEWYSLDLFYPENS